MTALGDRSDLPVVLLSHRGPVSFGRDESGHRTGSRGAGGLVTALTGLVSDLPDAVWVCAADSEEDRAMAAEHQGRAVEVALEPEPRVRDPDAAPEGTPAVRLRLVEVEPQAHDDFYTVIANPLLWFLQHGMYGLPSTTWSPSTPRGSPATSCSPPRSCSTCRSTLRR